MLRVLVRTICEDIKAWLRDDNTVHTRGYYHDIGLSLSHKMRIVDLYFQGYTYAEIMRRTHNSSHSIKRYVLWFGRLLLLKNRGIADANHLSRLLSQTERLIREYLELFEQHLYGCSWPRVYVELLDQL